MKSSSPRPSLLHRLTAGSPARSACSISRSSASRAAGSPGAPSLERLPGPFVLVAGDLRPSEAAELDWEKVLAVATDVGSSTYHTAIIARSLGIPAVVGLKDATRQTPAGSLVIVDGTRGGNRNVAPVSALASCTNPMPALAIRMATITMASRGAPSAPSSPQAMSEITIATARR